MRELCCDTSWYVGCVDG